jgi:hypothetical protein
MISVLASSVVDHGSQPGSGQTKHYKIVASVHSVKKKEQRLVDSESG